MTGACETRSASAIVSGETWLRSTSMPSRFISRTTSSPNGREPAVLSACRWPRRPTARCACASASCSRAPSACIIRSVAERVVDRVAALHADQRRDLARPVNALDVVGRARQLERVRDTRATMRWTMSICSSVARDRRLRPAARPARRPTRTARRRRPAAGAGCRSSICGCGTADVERCQVERRDVLAHRPRVVVVAVDERRPARGSHAHGRAARRRRRRGRTRPARTRRRGRANRTQQHGVSHGMDGQRGREGRFYATRGLQSARRNARGARGARPHAGSTHGQAGYLRRSHVDRRSHLLRRPLERPAHRHRREQQGRPVTRRTARRRHGGLHGRRRGAHPRQVAPAADGAAGAVHRAIARRPSRTASPAVRLEFDIEGDVGAGASWIAPIQLSRDKYCSVWNSLREDITLDVVTRIHARDRARVTTHGDARRFPRSTRGRPVAGRLAYLDWLRGARRPHHDRGAHARFLDARRRPPVAAYALAMIVGGIGAPLFLFLAGVAVALAAGSARRSFGRRRGRTIGPDARVGNLRARASCSGCTRGCSARARRSRGLLKVDILNVMGPSIVAAAGCGSRGRTSPARARVAGRRHGRRSRCITPFVRTTPWLDPLPDPIETYIRPGTGLLTFTLFPWAGSSPAGARSGSSCIRAAGAATAGDGIAAAARAAGAVARRRRATRRRSCRRSIPQAHFWTSSPTFFFLRTGVLSLACALAWAWAQRPWAAPPMEPPRASSASSSLFVYWIHVEMVYGLLTMPLTRRCRCPGRPWPIAASPSLMLGAVVLKTRAWSARRARRGGPTT